MALGHFPEGDLVTNTLLRCRQMGLSFEQAWDLSLHRAQGGRRRDNPRWADCKVGLLFARSAFERAYLGLPVTRQDQIARALLHAMEHMLDDSENAVSTELLEAA